MVWLLIGVLLFFNVALPLWRVWVTRHREIPREPPFMID